MLAASNRATSFCRTIRRPATVWSRRCRFWPPLIESNKPASEVLRLFTPYPQLLKNVRVPATVLDDPKVKAAIQAGENKVKGTGRILIRKSGTESLVRVMAEDEDANRVTEVVEMIAGVIQAAAG